MSADVLRSLSLFITYSLHKHNPSRPLRVKKSNIQMRRPGSLIPGALGGPMGSSIGGSMGGSMGGSILGGTGPKSGYLGIQGELNEEGSFTRQQIGVMILEMYEELLAEEGNGMAVIKKFAKTVTNKVCYPIMWTSSLSLLLRTSLDVGGRCQTNFIHHSGSSTSSPNPTHK